MHRSHKRHRTSGLKQRPTPSFTNDAPSRQVNKSASPYLSNDEDQAPDDESLLIQRVEPSQFNKPGTNNIIVCNFLQILRKCYAGKKTERNYAIIPILQDIIIGTLFGIAIMTLLLPLPTYLFRTALVEMINSPEILEILQKESSQAQMVIASERIMLAAREKKAHFLRNQVLRPLREEYNQLLGETGLDKFCDECHWGQGVNCEARVTYLLEKYSDSATTIYAKSDLINQGRCIRGD